MNAPKGTRIDLNVYFYNCGMKQNEDGVVHVIGPNGHDH